MTIYEKIKLIKQLSGLTQESLARQFDVSFATFNSWINNKSIPHEKKQIIINELYKKYTGQKLIPDSSLQAKNELLLKKSKKYKNIIKIITNRPDIYEQFILSLTYNSNKIEGSTFTEDQTSDVLFHNANIKSKSLIEHLEVKNHQSAIQFLFKDIKKDFIINEKWILKLHSILINSIRDDAGAYRDHGVRIVGANVPTANYLKVPELMKNLIKNTNKNSNDLIKHISQVHSRFEQIHPFSDGNGRIGRLIIIAMLLRENFAPAIIKQEKKRIYYQCLQRSQIHEDYTLLEDFISDSILEGYKFIEE